MAKRKSKKQGYGNTTIKLDEPTYKALACKKCGVDQDVPEDTKAVTCWKCVQSMVDPPKGHIPYDPVTRTFQVETRDKVAKPRGWHLKEEFVDKEGNVFYKGIEQPNLKGTIKPTKVAKRRSARQSSTNDNSARDTILVEINKLKKQLSKTDNKKEITKIKKEITKLEKKIK